MARRDEFENAEKIVRGIFHGGAGQGQSPPGVQLDASGMAIGTLLLGIGSVTMAVAQVAATRGNRVLREFEKSVKA